jgi:hypothetical protein
MIFQWIFSAKARRPWQSIILALLVILLSLEASPKLRSRDLLYDYLHEDLGFIRQRVFEYSGTFSIYVVPANVTYLLIEAYGAQANVPPIAKYSRSTTTGFITSMFNQPAVSPNGHFISTNVSVTPGQVLFIVVGGQDGFNAETCERNSDRNSGRNGDSKQNRWYGGSSDVRTRVDDATTRIVVAGGGRGGRGVGAAEGLLAWLSTALHGRSPGPSGQTDPTGMDALSDMSDMGRLCGAGSVGFTRGGVLDSHGGVRAGHGQVIITVPSSVQSPLGGGRGAGVGGTEFGRGGGTGLGSGSGGGGIGGVGGSRRMTARPTVSTVMSQSQNRRQLLAAPTYKPTTAPSTKPTAKPTCAPTKLPTKAPSCAPTRAPSYSPTRAPTAVPTPRPTRLPSSQPTAQPTKQPVGRPTGQPTRQPTSQPSRDPSRQPSSQPTKQPFNRPTAQPTRQPTSQPTRQPTRQPSAQPSRQVRVVF